MRICDICEKGLRHNNTIILPMPVYFKGGLTNNIISDKPIGVVDEEYELCEECLYKVAIFVEGLKK